MRVRLSTILLSLLIILSFFSVFHQTPHVKAEELQKGSFGNSNIPDIALINWTRFWNLFNAHTDWDLEYNDGSGWKNIKSDLQILKNYRVFVDDGWLSVNKSEATNCKITLNFTASYTANYRLTFGIDLDVKNYTHKEGSWNYSISYQNYTVCFDWSDIKEIPNLIVTHGIKPIDDDSWFWFRIRKDGVQKGKNVVIDPNFGYETIGSAKISLSQQITGSVFTISESGTADSITFYCERSLSRSVKCAIYKHSDSSLVGFTQQITQIFTPANWFTFNFSDPKPNLVINIAYVLVAWSSASVYYYYNTGEPFQGHYKTVSYNGFPNSITFSHEDRVYSIYCNYTVEAPPSEEWHSLDFNFGLQTMAWNPLTFNMDVQTRQWESIPFNLDLLTQKWNSLFFNFNLNVMAWHNLPFIFDLESGVWHSLSFLFGLESLQWHSLAFIFSLTQWGLWHSIPFDFYSMTQVFYTAKWYDDPKIFVFIIVICVLCIALALYLFNLR